MKPRPPRHPMKERSELGAGRIRAVTRQRGGPELGTDTAGARAAERPPSLSNLERKLLGELYAGDKSSAELAEACYLRSGDISALIAGLRRKGLVRNVSSGPGQPAIWEAV
jgi:hypothetical protein